MGCVFADFKQDVERWSSRVELTSTVIRNEDARGTLFVSQECVLPAMDHQQVDMNWMSVTYLNTLHTLDDNRQFRQRLDPPVNVS